VPLQNAFSTGARMMPTESYHTVVRAVITFIGDAVLDLLLDASIPAYNLYGLYRLQSDVLKLKAFAEASGIGHMAVSDLSCLWLLVNETILD
jgi:hypothetical protein